MAEQLHDASCRTITTTAQGMTITLAGDHIPPLVFTDEPRGIKVAWDKDPVLGLCWASFKAQCRECRAIFGGFWQATDPSPWPPDPARVRADGARLLVADDCREDAGGWLCGLCLGVPSDRRLLTREGCAPQPLEGWPKEA